MKKISNFGVLLATLVLFSSCASPYIELPKDPAAKNTAASDNTQSQQAAVETKSDVSASDSLSLGDATTAPAIDSAKQESATPVESKSDTTTPEVKKEEAKSDETKTGQTPASQPQTQNTQADVILVPLDQIWKAAEFPNDYKSSYAINYPDDFSFSVSRDADVYSHVKVTDANDTLSFEVKDIQLSEESASARAESAFNFFSKNGWTVVNAKLLLRQVTPVTRQLANDKNDMLYIVELPHSVVLLTISSKYVNDAHFVRQLLNSLKPAE